MDIESLKKQIAEIILKIKILQLELQKMLGQKVTIPNLEDPRLITIHHAAGYMNFFEVDGYHKKLWGFKSSLGFYIGYQYFIDRNAIVWQGRRDNEEGAHTKGFNKQSIGICLMGNGVIEDFTPGQYVKLKELVCKKLSEYNLTKSDVKPHSAFCATICPSQRLVNWINNLKVA